MQFQKTGLKYVRVFAANFGDAVTGLITIYTYNIFSHSSTGYTTLLVNILFLSFSIEPQATF